MSNLKEIAATLALMGSGTAVASGCEKNAEATEVPGSADPAPTPSPAAAKAPLGGESSCAAEHEAASEEAAGEGSCGGPAEPTEDDTEEVLEGGEGSCGGAP